MKDYLAKLIESEKSKAHNVNIIREYIQKYILFILYGKKYHSKLIFVGGTALRILYDLKRYSEDLDFSLKVKEPKFNFIDMIEKVKKECSLAGYDVITKSKVQENVKNSFLKFPGLLYEYGVSSHKKETVSVKVDIDCNPPEGGNTEISVNRSPHMFYIQHYDLSSLFAGKLHALFFRKYIKGRDWYDLLWYLTNQEKPRPNFLLLNNAIKQTDSSHRQVTGKNWKKILKKRVEECDFKRARSEVSKFLEWPEEVEFLKEDNFYKLLDEY